MSTETGDRADVERLPGPSKVTASDQIRQALVGASYEILPFKNTEEAVVAHVPTSIPLTVTTTEHKGFEATLDLTIRLRNHGYSVAPHIAARNVRDLGHLEEIATRLREADVDSLFVVGGDAAVPAGPFADAASLLRALRPAEWGFTAVGIGGYPEGHGAIDDAALFRALEDKAPMATQVVTQLCFDPRATLDWAHAVRARGVTLPIRVGIPGAVNRQKLIRISAGLGLGQSARLLKKQQSMLWRFFTPNGFSPNKLVKGLAPAFHDVGNGLGGFHVFTFNDLQATEAWRRDWIDRLS